MSSLVGELSRIAGEAFAGEGLDAGLGLVTLSDRPDLCQFQCNGALAAAKAVVSPASGGTGRANPRAIAEKIAATLKSDTRFAKVEIAGPGFINLDLTDAALAGLLEMARAPETTSKNKSKKLVIDFGGPNIAKPMAVHHLRSSIIGDCLQRLYRANGWTVISDVHLGDWGLQMGQLISEVELRGIAPVYFDAAFTGPYPANSRHGGIAGWPARLSRFVAPFRACDRIGRQPRIRQPGRQVRSLERRIQRP